MRTRQGSHWSRTGGLLAEARELRTSRASDPEPDDFPADSRNGRRRGSPAAMADLLGQQAPQASGGIFLSDLLRPQGLPHPRRGTGARRPIMVRVLPARALLTLLEAVKMDTLSESLDTAMVLALRRVGKSKNIDWPAYVAAYRTCGRKKDRENNRSSLIDQIGRTLDRLTRMPLIHFSLKLMSGPAHLAGLGALPSFLQRGFDAFSYMKGADEFLEIVIERETALMKELFANPNARGRSRATPQCCRIARRKSALAGR